MRDHLTVTLLSGDARSSSRRSRQFRHRIGSHLCGLVVCVAVWAFLLFAASELPTRTVTPLRFAGAAIGLALLALVPMAIARLLWIHVRAGARESNWVARLDETGVYLNLRSWLNWRLDSDEQTVAFIPYAAIANVHEVREQFDVYQRVSPRIRYCAFIALTLDPSVDVTPLDDAVRAELHRVHSHPSFVRGTQAWDDVPLFVRPDRSIWITRTDPSLMNALGERVPCGPLETRHTRVGEVLAVLGADGAAPVLRDVMYHARWSDALQVTQFQLGLGYDESVRYLDELLTNGTSSCPTASA